VTEPVPLLLDGDAVVLLSHAVVATAPTATSTQKARLCARRNIN
jgi:hypothetical protein